MKILKLMFVLLVAVGTALTLAIPAQAVAAKFHSTTSMVTKTGDLRVSFDERGLGHDNIDYTLRADARATYACVNGGGKHPKAANKEAFEQSVSGSASFEPKNGRVVAGIALDAPAAAQFQCPKGQKRVLAAVSYRNIVLTDTTNASSVSVADASRTFYAF